MALIDLTDTEQGELRKLLRDSIDLDRFKVSEGVQAWTSVLAKLDPKAAPAKPKPAALKRPASGIEAMLRASIAELEPFSSGERSANVSSVIG